MLATPAFQRAKVDAYAYRVHDPDSMQVGTYLIPELHEERIALVARMLAEAQPLSRD